MGTAVLQLARACGARVAVTAGSLEKADWCRSHGADRVIDYRRESLADALREFAPGGFDVYWEATRGLELEAATAVMAEHGRPSPFRWVGFILTSLSNQQLALAARQLNGWLARGILKGRVHSNLTLSESALAHRLVEAGDLFGKVLIVP